jgi:hypothetical protein
VKNGFTPTASRRGKSRNDLVGDPNTDVVGVAPVPAPAARPRPLPAPRPPRAPQARYQRVDPSPVGRVDPPAGNAVHATGAPYAAPGFSEGYGQGGYAAAPQMDAQAAYSPLLVALMQAMRGGYA